MNIKIKIPPSYRAPLMIALALHVILLLFLALNHDGSRAMGAVTAPLPIVHARAVNSAAVNREIAKIKQAAVVKKRAEQVRVKHLAEVAAAAKAARLREQKRVQRLKAEQVKLQRERAHQLKQLQILKREKEVAAKKLAARRLAEKKVAAERKKATELKAQAQRKKLQALAQQQKQLQEKLLKQQLASDQAQINQIQAAHMQQLVNQYTQQIKRAVRSHWLKPASLGKANISSQFLVTVAPGGVVLNVKLARSSGNGAFDQSAKDAIYKTSPLPVPKDATAFNQFRHFYFTFYANPDQTSG